MEFPEKLADVFVTTYLSYIYRITDRLFLKSFVFEFYDTPMKIYLFKLCHMAKSTGLLKQYENKTFIS